MRLSQICTALALTSVVSTTVHAQVACPLTNSRLTSLRSAAQGLAKSITLTGACSAYQTNLNNSNQELITLADKIQAVGDTATADGTSVTSSTDFKTLASQTVTQLNNINTIFKDQKCGEQLASNLDYAESFVDVAINATPFLALYGGATAAPWVLGTALGGAAAKIMIGFFKGKVVDMRSVDQSSAFIKNSCSFYFLNQIKTSMDDLQVQQIPSIQLELQAAQVKLKQFSNQSMPEPKSDLYKLSKLVNSDKARLASIQTKFANDSMEGCSFMGRYIRGEDSRTGEGLVERNWRLYKSSSEASEDDFTWEKDYFDSSLSTPLSAEFNSDTCTKIGTRWLAKVKTINDKNLAWLAPQLTKDEEIKSYQEWLDKKNQLAQDVKTLEARIKFFNEITGTGFNIEYSEIIQGHEQVQDGLFDSYRYLAFFKMRGLAEAWLKVKYEDGDNASGEFKRRKKDVNDRLGRIQKLLGTKEINRTNLANFAKEYKEKTGRDHPEIHGAVIVDVCNQLRMTWSTWYNGLIHAQAGKDYCKAFDNVINRLDYPGVQNLCFGTVDARTNRSARSLKNLVTAIKAQKPEADEVRDQMKQYSCDSSTSLTEQLLATGLTATP